MAKKKRRKWIWLRYRKNDVAHNVQVAVQRWIHARGGTVVVLGGIGIMPEGFGKYQVCVGIVGKQPDPPPDSDGKAGDQGD